MIVETVTAGRLRLNGIDAARRIHTVAVNSKILFLSQECSQDIAQEIMNAGASGYVMKPRAESDLLLAIEAVLGGKPFLSPGLEN